MSTEFGLFSQPDFGYDDFVATPHEQPHEDVQYDEARNPGLQEAAHSVRRELVRLDEVPRPLIQNKHFIWKQGRLKLSEDILEYFTEDEVAAQVRELEARGPSYRPTTSNTRGSLHLDWDGDVSVVDLHSETVGGEHPEFVRSLLGGGRQGAVGQPAQVGSLPASAETIALPGPPGISGPDTKSRSRSQQVTETGIGSDPDGPSMLSRAWGLRPNMDWRSMRAWRKRLKRAEWTGYLLAAELVTPVVIGLTPGDSPIQDKNYFLQTPVAVYHGIGRLIGFGRWIF
jgi:hypothetical protein